MIEAETEFATPNAGKYLQQLCKHFAHKVPAEWTQAAGRVQLPAGECRLTASDGVLRIDCRADTPEGLPMLVKIVEVHLQRFAFREPPQLSWTSNGEPASGLMAQLAAMPDPHQARAG